MATRKKTKKATAQVPDETNSSVVRDKKGKWVPRPSAKPKSSK